LGSQGRHAAERLAEALTLATSDDDMRARASQLEEKIRAEQGVDRAVEIVL
jgi:UDP:flavonoid glycosyltransferase YjiC (YdhE family)